MITKENMKNEAEREEVWDHIEHWAKKLAKTVVDRDKAKIKDILVQSGSLEFFIQEINKDNGARALNGLPYEEF